MESCDDFSLLEGPGLGLHLVLYFPRQLCARSLAWTTGQEWLCLVAFARHEGSPTFPSRKDKGFAASVPTSQL